MSTPESQLEDQQIIDLKAQFHANPELIGAVASHIVQCSADEMMQGEEPWFDDQVDRQAFVSSTRQAWEQALNAVLEVPGAEWHEAISSPTTVARALEAVLAESE